MTDTEGEGVKTIGGAIEGMRDGRCVGSKDGLADESTVGEKDGHDRGESRGLCG